ncbi:hypothetical protein [Rhodoferax saidenbachensis]|uniref:ElaB/YqjD/DUF883 family membrane-anchored ribosome-binding protein n=1 Tax=Rhodoferax saidenbachensis TaxID=1484693 RepID=A0ABU1ZJS2_9BURK|nr:hypothetical protein [Rhodoferax saidenbachensis]MDR7305794.1 ElaB/YqjD/DUF883 family membrane-anchored ribosome-binding protein [Rhodoferax saidenbachensis]
MTELNHLSDGIAHEAGSLETSVHGAIDRLAGVAAQTGEKLELAGHKLQDAQSRVTAECRNLVQKNPLTSVGVALVSGLLLGWVVRRR